MPAPDAHTRSKISLNPSKFLYPTSISSKTLPRIVLANVLFVVAIQVTKEWLLDFDVGVFWVLMRVLACGAFGVLVWEGVTGQVRKRKSIEWSALAMASLLVFVQFGSLFTALYRLPAIRVVLFSHFSSYFVTTIVNFTTVRKVFAILAAFALAVVTDAGFSKANIGRYLPGYAALFMHGFVSLALDHTVGFIAPSIGPTFTIAAAILGASIFCLPFYIFRTALLHFPPTPPLPIFSLVAIPFVAYSLLFMTPLTKHSFTNLSLAPQYFRTTFPTLAAVSAVLGPLAFSHFPVRSDLLLALLLYFGMHPESVNNLPLAPRTPASRLLKSYLKSILSNPESRKIFYFLMLNLCYMLVQMLYGVWTNSLGLISDAIHMAFDCMAIGVGLLASVMATWDPNERFTYGYGRIETLSGFANGIFLVLISIFIVFEAIQRILDPPEMNTNQLLLVSSVGLAVNLFGMFAMGGHHHGGGGHSHSHSHSFSFFGSGGHDDHSKHSHGDHGPSHSGKDDHHDHSHSQQEEHFGHSHTHHEDESHSHSHSQHESHSHSHSHNSTTGSRSHSPPQSQLQCPSHSESPSHQHSHSPDPTHDPDSCDLTDHSHSHSGHGHSHSPSNELSHKPHTHSHHDTLTHTPDIHSSSHSHSPPPNDVVPQSKGHSRSTSTGDRPRTLASRRHSRAGSLSIQANFMPSDSSSSALANGDSIHMGGLMPPKPGSAEVLQTPITPAYTFGKDAHNDHHHDLPTPNVNAGTHSGHGGHGHNGGGHAAHSGHSHNMRGVFLHIMADTLGSVGVIISTLLIQFYGWTGFDPIASLFIAVLIAASVIPLVVDTGKILALDVGEHDEAILDALQQLSTIEGLASYSCARFWPKDSSTIVGSIHVHLSPSAASIADPGGPHSTVRTTYTKVDKVVGRVDGVLKRRIPGLEELTIQVVGGSAGGGTGY